MARLHKHLWQLPAIIVAGLTLLITGLIYLGPISSLGVLLNSLTGAGINSPSDTVVQQRLQVPTGFSIAQYASGLQKIRFMEFSRSGDLIVSQPREGKVLLLKRDLDGDGQHDGTTTLLSGLTRPHGLEFYRDWLYIAESNAIGRVRFNHASGQLTSDYEQLITGLTDNGNHWSKSIRIQGDFLYISLGSTCNVCTEKDTRRATIMRYTTDGRDGQIFARGLRNSVGLDFAPWDQQLYATDNGRDLLGDDYPVCELNRIEEGQFYGWPHINGFGDPDPDYGYPDPLDKGKNDLVNRARSPVFGFPPHNAPLGIRFIHDINMPAGYERSALVALHGSWNRSEPDGYKVVSLHWAEDGTISSRDFLTGFESDGNIIGRPVDIAEGPDGCLYISDDYGGSIFRVCYGLETLNKNNDESEGL